MDEFWLEESSQGSFEAFNDFMRGEPGPYFTPRVDANGNLIWTNNGDLPNPETVNIKGPKGNTGNNGQDGKSAYQAAVEGGYRGSEGSFNDYMAKFPSMASNAQTAASQASTAAGQAAASAAHAEELVDTLPDDYEDLLQDTAKTMQAVEALTVGPVALATFNASAADMPLKGLTVNIEPVQAGEGDPSPENVRPITGWTGCKLHRTGISLIGGDAFLGNAFTKTESGYELTYEGGGVSQRSSAYADITGLPAGRYTLQFINYTCPDGCAVTFRFRSPGGSWTTLTIIGGTAYGRRTFTMHANAAQIQFYFSPNTASVGDKLTADDVVLMREEDAETPEPYKGNTYDITFPTEAGTVYGGTLDVVNKKLTVDRAIVDLGSLTWVKTAATISAFYYRSTVNNMATMTARTMPIMSTQFIPISDGRSYADCPDQSIYNLSSTNANVAVKDMTYDTASDFKAAVTGAMLVYQLASPIVYDLSDVPEITTLLGTNNIWADAGDVTVTYGAYLETLKASLDRTNSDLANLRACIAPTEDGDTASQTYVQGAYFFRNGSFCVALLEISSGDQFTLGTNYKVVSVAEAILAMSFVILEQPVNSETAVDDMASFTVNARGVQSYQWQYWTPSSTKWNDNTGDISHQPTFSIQATTARYTYKYHCKLTSYDGTVIYTNEVKIVQPS